jgi:hypothetical protein
MMLHPFGKKRELVCVVQNIAHPMDGGLRLAVMMPPYEFMTSPLRTIRIMNLLKFY